MCRSTIVPGMESMAGRSGRFPGTMVTQSVTLGDHLVGVTTNTTLMNITVIKEFQQDDSTTTKDLHFFYTTPQ